MCRLQNIINLEAPWTPALGKSESWHHIALKMLKIRGKVFKVLDYHLARETQVILRLVWLVIGGLNILEVIFAAGIF